MTWGHNEQGEFKSIFHAVAWVAIWYAPFVLFAWAIDTAGDAWNVDPYWFWR